MSDPTIGLKALVSKMIGKDCLNNWDMLVAYSQDQLNEVLRRRSEKITGISDMAPFDVSVVKSNPFQPGPSTVYTMALKLSEPLMMFTGEPNAAMNLTFKLSGTSTNKGTKECVPLQPGLLLKASSYLLSVQGTTSGGLEDLTPSPDKPPSPANSVVLLEPGTVHGVCIDLREATFVVVQDEKAGGAKIDQSILDSYSINLGPYIAAELKNTAALKYCIAGVSPAPPSSKGSYLKPTSFCFSSTSGKSPALLMWIGVEGGHGNGSASVSFHPDSLDRSPIPEGSTASLLISHDIMATKFVQTSLENAGFTSIVSLNGKSQEGMKFNVKCPPMRETKEGESRNILRIDPYDYRFGAIHHVDGIDIDVSETYAQLVLRSPQPLRGDSLPSPKYSVEYEQTSLQDLFKDGKHNDKDAILTWISPQQTVNWNFTDLPMDGFIPPNNNYGTFTLDCSFAASADWIGSSHQLSMSWTIDSDFHIHMESLDQDPRTVSSSYGDFKPTLLASFTIDMTPLNYFLATNLLFPGEDIFIPDEPSKTSEAKGLGIPRDTILTGTISSPSSSFPPIIAASQMRRSKMTPSTHHSSAFNINNSQAQAPIPRGQVPYPSEAALKFINTFGDFLRDDPLYKHLFDAAVADCFDERSVAFDKAFQRFGLTATPDELIALIGWDRKTFLKAAEEGLSKNRIQLSSSNSKHASGPPPTTALQSNNETGLPLSLMKAWATVYDTSDGSMFVVYPDTGYFGYPYKKDSTNQIKPEVLSANQAQWTLGAKTYVITFTAEPDLDNMVFKNSFVCQVTSPDTVTSFTGTQKKANTTISDMNTVITVMGLGFGLFSIMMAIVSCRWRRNDQKAKIKDNEALLQALDERIREITTKEAKEKTEAVEARCRRLMLADVAWPNGNYQRKIEDEIRKHIDTSPHQWKNSIEEIGNAILEGRQNKTIDDIRKDMMDALKKAIINGVSENNLIKWEKRFMLYEDTGILKDGRIGELAKECIEKQLVTKIETIHNGTSWIEDRFREKFTDLLKDKASNAANELEVELDILDRDMRSMEGYPGWEKAAIELKALEKEENNRDPEEKKAALQKARDKLDQYAELNAKEVQAEELRQKIEKHRKLADSLDKEADAARTKAQKKQESEKMFEQHA